MSSTQRSAVKSLVAERSRELRVEVRVLDPFSFRHQIAVAAARGDGVAVNNATAKWLASYFDVVFAANRVLHPGEKRLIDFATSECGLCPAHLERDVSTLLDLAAAMHPSVGPHVDEMVARLDSEVITLR